eukprot:CAMPEP_0116123544 /NCGR_PEP_ID=MMETSP0329-20121206/4805_1 /TAXON_ID=697910 /ORGANISM="Pseudo-nitzschia arenysensis, Strain B593" /LENGTH=129 /DNA_ID=CAMNT_0003617467 /DNA_START=149 /DNA_END=538 /DNA_ORIENTATION=-
MIRTLANRSASWTRTATTCAFSKIPQNTTNFTAVRGMATKKAGGSTNNGRDSIGRRLGVKILHNQPAKAGSILVRQRGQKFRAGENVGIGKDHTLFARIAGVVRMEKIRLEGSISGNKKRIRNVVHVDV